MGPSRVYRYQPIIFKYLQTDSKIPTNFSNFQMLPCVSKCLQRSQNDSRYVPLFSNVSNFLCMSPDVPKCYPNVPTYLQNPRMFPNISKCLHMSLKVSNCFVLSPISRNFPRSPQMSPDAIKLVASDWLVGWLSEQEIVFRKGLSKPDTGFRIFFSKYFCWFVKLRFRVY